VRKVLLGLLVCLFATLISPDSILAKKKIQLSPRSTAAVSTRVIISPRFRADRKALLITFSNLNVATEVNYELSYNSAGIGQGVIGTIRPQAASVQKKELYFGTCSHNVCKPHLAISDMRLVVTSSLNSGLKVRKTYRVKI